MEIVKLKNKEYRYAVDFKDNNFLRNSFNDLTKKTYEFDFEDWYQNGYWDDNYIPYALLDDDKIIANVSVSIIDFLVLSKKKRGVQIGTVMTDDAYRKQGLSRFLMDKVMEEWESKCDLIYLFANDSVLNFYPKFGFIVQDEYQHTIELVTGNRMDGAIKLDMSQPENRDFLAQMINSSIHFSEFAMIKNVSLIMFYCTSFMKENVYYIKDLNATVIAAFEKDILYLNDIFSPKEVSIDAIVSVMANKEIKKIVLGFTPANVNSYEVNLLPKEGTTLFVLENKEDIFNNKQFRFPVLSHA